MKKEFTFMGKGYKVEGNTAVEINNNQEQDERVRNRKVDNGFKKPKYNTSQSKSNKRDMGNSASVDLKELKEKIEGGCGKFIPKGCKGYKSKTTCGESDYLCPKCKAKLETINQVEEIIKEWILNLEKHFIFSYVKGTNERIIQFNPSVKVWEKEFKEKLK